MNRNEDKKLNTRYVRLAKFGKVELTEKGEKWLISRYKCTKNDEICEKLGISGTALHRFARSLGLTKTRQFMRKCQRATADAAKASHLRNGTYPPKGYIIPGSEQYRFKAGVTPEQRLGKRREAQRIAKAVESRKKTFRTEYARMLFGLPQQTKLRVIRRPFKMIQQRSYLRKRGYIIDEVTKTAYWTSETKRATRMEARPREFYYFAPLPVETEKVNAKVNGNP